MQRAFEKIIERLEAKKTELYEITAKCNATQEVRNINHGYVVAMSHAIEIVNQVASEYGGGWIPCSERLPEESGEYYTYVYYDGQYIYSIDEIDCDGILKEWNCSSDYKIIAWKPIEPYKAESEDSA